MSDIITDPVQEEIVAEFAMFDDWLDKYDYLIELGNALGAIDPAHRTDNYAINGCQSRVWVDARLDDGGRVWFSADSDAIITKGIISLLIRVFNGRTPREILDTELYFVDRTGLGDNLSPTRANGLVAMLKQMRMYAMAFDGSAAAREKNGVSGQDGGAEKSDA
ncbi:MAG: SufE family protein [Alistipes sp.]|jgi:cysteine desulfuration protein SufE|nr:SufE family protein [Alistipes sp.]